jgi:hypothetical protein
VEVARSMEVASQMSEFNIHHDFYAMMFMFQGIVFICLVYRNSFRFEVFGCRLIVIGSMFCR